MFKKFFSFLLIISIFSTNFDFHAHHAHDCHDYSHSSISECEDCKYINEVKNEFININNAFFQKVSIDFFTLNLNNFLIHANLESKKSSRAPPFSS